MIDELENQIIELEKSQVFDIASLTVNNLKNLFNEIKDLKKELGQYANE